MEKTGERYSTARQALLPTQASGRRQEWVSEPEHSDDVIVARTGRSWDDWCDLIESWPGHVDGHPAIAAWVEAEHGQDGWWSQAVTGGYERIVGIRLPNQMPDGTFTANKSRTVGVAADVLRSLLLDDEDRQDILGGEGSELRSKPSAKAIRVAVGPGVAHIALNPKGDERTQITVGHRGLPSPDAVAEWKFYWDEWLTALDTET